MSSPPSTTGLADPAATLRADVRGDGARTVILANGFGTTRDSWDAVIAMLPEGWRIVRFDYVGNVEASAAAWDAARHSSLEGHAGDVLALLEVLDVRDAVFVGHSMSAMIGALVRVAAPQRVAQLVMLGASPRYIDDVGYWGGFSRAEIDAIIDAATRNLEQWVAGFAPLALGEHADATHIEEFVGTLVRMRPDIALSMVRMLFEADLRAILPRITCPVVLLQSHVDAAVPPIVGVYLQKRLPNATLDVLPVNGHVPHLTHPAIVGARLARVLREAAGTPPG